MRRTRSNFRVVAFRGWPVEAIEFYEGLEADNTKTYWTANKDVYEDDVKAPMQALLEQVSPEFGDSRIFRPYRDVRFSNDKSPYKTNIAAVCERDDTIHYVSLSSEGLFVGSGYYHMAKDQLDRYRRAVAADDTGPDVERLVGGLEKAGYEVGGEELKRAPRGYDPDHPRVRLLRHKGLYFGKSFEPAAWLGTKKAADRIVKVWRDAGPLNAWLARHVGPSTEPERHR